MENVTFIEKQFSPASKSRVMDNCLNQNQNIYRQLCKLTYFNSPNDWSHWKDQICGAITNNQKELPGKRVKFSYLWFFDYYGNMNEDTAQSFLDSMPNKYRKLKPFNPDLNIFMNNCERFRELLVVAYDKKGRLLNKEDILSCINQLELYDKE